MLISFGFADVRDCHRCLLPRRAVSGQQARTTTASARDVAAPVYRRSVLAEDAPAEQVAPAGHSDDGDRFEGSHLGPEPATRHQAGRERRGDHAARATAASRRPLFSSSTWKATCCARGAAPATRRVARAGARDRRRSRRQRLDFREQPRRRHSKFTGDGKFLWDFGHRGPKPEPGKTLPPIVENNRTPTCSRMACSSSRSMKTRASCLVEEARAVYDMDNRKFKRGWGATASR